MADGMVNTGVERNRASSNFNVRFDAAIADAARWLAGRQRHDGHWVGQIETNACMEAQWILALWFMEVDDHPLRARLAESLRQTQRNDGSWEVFKNAPAGDINATVEAYAALRAMGTPKDDPALAKAYDWIMARGGLKNIRVFTRYWLALIGEYPWKRTPNLPPEVIYFPNWFPFSIYNFAQWARATLVPIAVLSASRPSRPLPPENRLDELFPGGREAFDYRFPKKPNQGLADRFFLIVDRLLHIGQSIGFTPLRRGAVRRMLGWIVEHQDGDGVWGGIQPPWIYSLMALYAEGYAINHPNVAKGLSALDDPNWRVDRGEATWIQASTSPVWDTVLTLMAMEDAEQNEAYSDEVEKAVDWVLARQVRHRGDWQVKVRGVEPGGWAFEYCNNFYPDTDDTAVALIALAPFRDHPKFADKGIKEAIDRGVNWLFGMQCRGGGWAAFDKDNDKAYLTKIPFCDFGEALDPPSVDVTAHIIEAFGKLGLQKSHPQIARGIEYMKKEQEPNGAWFGRWGVNYIYGTGAVLPALEAIGEDMTQEYIGLACDWLVSVQQGNGGWGEGCESYMDVDAMARGNTTASQTAWALMGLIAVNRAEDREAIELGISYLMDRQTGGTWNEPEYAGTGFPGYGVGATIKLGDPKLSEQLKQGPELSRAFMLNYNLYRQYFPLMALGRWKRLQKEAG